MLASFFSHLRDLIRGFRLYRQYGGRIFDFLLIVFGVERIPFLTDCYDTQTQMRIVPTRINYDVEPIEAFRPGQIQIGYTLLGLVLTRLKYDVKHLPLKVVFGNAAPRYGHSTPGQAVDMVLAYLPEAHLLYVGTGGECLSLVRRYIDTSMSFVLKLTDEPTDYRSAFIPRTFERLLRGDRTPCVAHLSLDSIPVPSPQLTVQSVDSFGNIMLLGEIPNLPELHTKVDVTIGEVTITGHIGKNLGDAEEGEIVVSPGSTSRLLSGESFGVLYVYQLQGSALKAFQAEGHSVAPGDVALLAIHVEEGTPVG